MDPIFEKNGKVVGWFRREDAIVDPLGEYRAMVSNGAVFDFHSHYLGRLHDGYIWDRDGKAVAFVMGAKGGPVLPHAGAVPPPPVAGPEPAKPSRIPAVPRAPPYTKKWSEMSWDDFLGGRHIFIAYHR